MSYRQCSKCGYVPSQAIHCAGCGASGTVGEVNPEALDLRASLAAAEAERDRLREALDRDKTGLAAALNKVQRVARGYWWLTEGRGPYRYDDDEYRLEAGRALRAIMDEACRALLASGKTADEVLRFDRSALAEPTKGGG